MKQIHVAVGLIVNAQADVLLAKRAAHQHQGGLWEFPGGKVEAGEPVELALARELKEELAITVTKARPFIQVAHKYADKSVLLDVWLVSEFAGQAQGVEGQPLRWVPKSELTGYAFPEANLPILNSYLLGEHLLISGAIDFEKFEQQLQRSLVARKPTAFMLRAHELDAAGYQTLALQAAAICAPAGIALLLNHASAISTSELVLASYPSLTVSVHANRHHDLASWRAQLPAGVLLGSSCHDQTELQRAAALADYALLSPLLPTASHPEAAGLGWQQFAALASAVALPVFALGGVSAADLAQVKASSGFGCAGISDGWQTAQAK